MTRDLNRQYKRWPEGHVIARELLHSGKTYGYIVCRNTPAYRGTVTKAWKVNYKEQDITLGAWVYLGTYEGYFYNYDADEEGPTRVAIHELSAKLPVWWVDRLPTKRKYEATRPPSPYRPLVDRPAWRDAGGPQGQMGKGGSWEFWTHDGLELATFIGTTVGLKSPRPKYKGISERGVYLKWVVPHDVVEQDFAVACDMAHELHNFPSPSKIIRSELTAKPLVPMTPQLWQKFYADRDAHWAELLLIGYAVPPPWIIKHYQKRERKLKNPPPHKGSHYYLKLEYDV